MARPKKVKVEVKEVEATQAPTEPTESTGPTDKEILTNLYEQMKTYGINSISDVEVKLSRL